MMETMFILHAEHADKARPYAEPIPLSWSIGKFMTIPEMMEFAEPKDDRFELVKLWLEVRFVPRNCR